MPVNEGNAVSPQLKLIALDAEDLAVISAHVQDARVQTCDIVWRQGDKRLVVGMNRLDWEQTLAGETSPRRLIAALRFDRVLSTFRRRRRSWSWSESSSIRGRRPAAVWY